MREYTTTFREGVFLWEITHHRLVRYHDNELEVISGANDAAAIVSCFPIPINEEILYDLLGFTSDGRGGYQLEACCIVFDGTEQTGMPFSIDGRPILYLNDLQVICEDKGVTLNIDETKLYHILSGRFFQGREE